jgi:phytoene synthase
MTVTAAESWDTLLARSREYCRELSIQQAKNFYHGMKLVPEPKRSAMFALYAWMREADDLADAEGELAAKERALSEFLAQTDRAISGPVEQMPEGRIWPAVRDMVLTYQIPREYLQDMIAGQLLDQHKTRYKTFDELYDYCYKVASVVGLCCIAIWGYDGGEETRKLAEWRGIAFQLTNILRDVLEDAERDRVYLPAQEFGLFELNPTMFTMSKPAEVLPGIKKMIAKAAEYYTKSAPLDRRVRRDGRPCLWAMTEIYRGLLEKIVNDPAVVLSGQRVRLSKPRKLWIALRASLQGASR